MIENAYDTIADLSKSKTVISRYIPLHRKKLPLIGTAVIQKEK